MRIILTGGAGFIGSHIARGLLDEGHQLTIIDNLTSGSIDNLPSGVDIVETDIRSGDAAKCVEDFAPDVLIHHAAQVDVRRSVNDPGFDAEVNVLGTLNLLDSCVRAGTKRVLFASTGGAIYGEQDTFPAGEDHSIKPISPYGCSKASVELYLNYFGEVHGLSWTALRYANVYGPRQDPHGEAGVVAIFCGRLLSGEPCTIFGDGKQTRDYVFVRDVVRANLLALKSNFCGVLNIGTGVETNVLELYEHLADAAGLSIPPCFSAHRTGEQLRSCIDPAMAEKVLGWRALTDLKEGIAITFEHFQSERRSAV